MTWEADVLQKLDGAEPWISKTLIANLKKHKQSYPAFNLERCAEFMLCGVEQKSTAQLRRLPYSIKECTKSIQRLKQMESLSRNDHL